MDENLEKVLEGHKVSTVNMITRLDGLYQKICDSEHEILDRCKEDIVNLIQLLESIKDIHCATKMLQEPRSLIDERVQEAEDQIGLLQKSFDLMLVSGGETAKEPMEACD